MFNGKFFNLSAQILPYYRFLVQKPVEKRLRTYKQHQAIEDDKIKETIPEKSRKKDTGKSLSKDLLRKVKRKIFPCIYSKLLVQNCTSKLYLYQ